MAGSQPHCEFEEGGWVSRAFPFSPAQEKGEESGMDAGEQETHYGAPTAVLTWEQPWWGASLGVCS